MRDGIIVPSLFAMNAVNDEGELISLFRRFIKPGTAPGGRIAAFRALLVLRLPGLFEGLLFLRGDNTHGEHQHQRPAQTCRLRAGAFCPTGCPDHPHDEQHDGPDPKEHRECCFDGVQDGHAMN
jgi:hypothetical protein